VDIFSKKVVSYRNEPQETPQALRKTSIQQ
jgi:hypothetical protein